MILDVAPDLLQLGLCASALVARGLDNTRTSPELLAYRRAVGQRLAAHWKNRSVSSHPAIREYHRVHEAFGVAGEPPAPEKLITYVRRQRDFSAVGAVVDCYNIVSARTLLSNGAHDLARLATPVTLRRCTANDVFVPLGQSEPRSVTGEYGYVDSQGRVICRLEVLQGDYSKVTRESRDVAFILQGNRLLPAAILLKGTWLLAEMLEKFCGGQVELVNFHDAASAAEGFLNRPLLDLDSFKRLDLRKGTVEQSRPLPGLPALSAVSVAAGRPAAALAPTAALPQDPAGLPVLFAADLHPLRAAGQAFTAYLFSVQGAAGGTALQVTAAIPDGTRLF